MSNLVLDSLEIKNFRAFQHLQIEKLGRVNLIVGKNNVGKSSLLEALRIYAEQGEPSLLYRIMSQRDEMIIYEGDSRRTPMDVPVWALALNNLFFERRDTRQPHTPILIGSASDVEDTLQIDVHWPFPEPPTLLLQFGHDKHNVTNVPLAKDMVWAEHIISIGYAQYVNTFVVEAGGMTSSDLAILWDMIALSDLQEEVVNALKIITPQIMAISFVGSIHSTGTRIPIIRALGSNGPVPLRSMGEGMNRMLGIALALVNAKDGMLLIDEVDTGLHYSVLPDLWKLIFEVAHRLNVQVFATSHSWDCIQAFQQAAAANEAEEGMLVRLENRKEGVAAVVFDERDLAIVTREQIEVR